MSPAGRNTKTGDMSMPEDEARELLSALTVDELLIAFAILEDLLRRRACTEPPLESNLQAP